MPVVGTEERRLARELWDTCAIPETNGEIAFRVVLEGGGTLHVDPETRVIEYSDRDFQTQAANLGRCFNRYLMDAREYTVRQREQ